MNTQRIRRGAVAALAGVTLTGLAGGMAPLASASASTAQAARAQGAHPVAGCNSRTHPGFRVQHIHLISRFGAKATVCKAFKRRANGTFTVKWKAKIGRSSFKPVLLQAEVVRGTLPSKHNSRSSTKGLKVRGKTLKGIASIHFRVCHVDEDKGNVEFCSIFQ